MHLAIAVDVLVTVVGVALIWYGLRHTGKRTGEGAPGNPAETDPSFAS